MIERFIVAPELQQFLQGVESKALTNVVWDIVFPSSAPVLPTNPSTVRRALMFDRGALNAAATPVIEYNCYSVNLDGTEETIVTVSRDA